MDAKKVKAELLTIGDEILIGQIVDTNSQWMGAELGKLGVHVVRKTSIGDAEAEILEALKSAEEKADVILITGGLGPTKDDITKKTLSKYFGCGMELREEALEKLTQFFQSRGKEVSETNKTQAVLPTACTYLPNLCGTAPGMWFERNGKIFVSMPGVPFEMKDLMTREVLPRIQKEKKLPSILHKLIRTVGVGESVLSDMLEEWEQALPSNMKLAYLPAISEVKLRLTCYGSDLQQLNEEANACLKKMLPAIQEYVFGYSEAPLEQALGKYLTHSNLTLSSAESCTGGYLSHLLTSIPGSSDYYKGSVVAYHNEVKMQELKVPLEILQTHGAVSEETVRIMASEVRKKLKTDIGLAATGIAGPGGGTDEKPVGTVWIAYADKDKVVSKKLQLTNRRDLNIRMSAYAMLNLMRRERNVHADAAELWEMNLSF
jgi:nicotinamide-nucleotide amidase